MPLLSCTREIFPRPSLSATLPEMQTRAGHQLMAQLQRPVSGEDGRSEGQAFPCSLHVQLPSASHNSSFLMKAMWPRGIRPEPLHDRWHPDGTYLA